MNKIPRTFKFHETYESASWLESAATDPSSFFEMPWEDDGFTKALGQFSKLSLLHNYIFYLLAVEKRIEYSKNYHDRGPEDINEFKKVFREYEIELRDEKAFQPFGDDYDEYEHFYLWFQFHEESFSYLWEQITDEVFHLLFANRSFLLNFNKSLSYYLRDNPNLIPPEYRNRSGKIKRAKNIPVWAKKAVFFRDQGKCVLCFRDLSGLLSTENVVHFDHIVPLNSWGVNDPCNLQLLCEDCNIRKGGNQATTSSRYIEWW